MSYYPRIIETEIGLKLKASGALLIKGPNRVAKLKQQNLLPKVFTGRQRIATGSLYN
jgi:hypothetical protein